jgi:hypothetical protein
MFYPTILNLTKFLTKYASKLFDDEYDLTIMATIDAWNHSDFMCKKYILNCLENTLYDVYNSIKKCKGTKRGFGSKVQC